MPRKPRVIVVALALVAISAAVAGALTVFPQLRSQLGADATTTRPEHVVFVATDGDDADDGSESAPFRTLKAAVQVAEPGTVVYVRGGAYDERVDFSQSGTEGRPITFEAYKGEKVTISRGFRVTGDHNIVRGFTVYPGESDMSVFQSEQSEHSFYERTAGQIQITGSNNLLEGISHHDEDGVTPPGVSSLVFLHGSHNTVRDIDFHHCHTVVFAGNDREPEGSGRHNKIAGGTIHHTDRAFFSIEADDATVEDLDLHDTGQVDKSSQDADAADGIVLNGARITIRGCTIHRVFAQAINQHTDAIQWWNVADDLLIEGNVIGSAGRGGDLGLYDQGHIQWTSESQGKTSQRVIIRNNVFLGTDVPYIINGSPQQTIPGQADDWRIVGNTFVSRQSIRRDLLQACTGWVISGNVFHSSGPFENPLPGNRISHNCYVGCDPAPGEEGSFRTDDAGFSDPDLSESSEYGVEADWRPVPASPLVGAGVPLKELPTDMTGAERPDPPSLGALEVARD